jgi:hypothetical protein
MRTDTSSCTWFRPKIIAEDVISFANVLRLFSISSSLESRVSKESCRLGEEFINVKQIFWIVTHRKLAYSAGTKQPTIAITVRRPVWRKYVLFP